MQVGILKCNSPKSLLKKNIFLKDYDKYIFIGTDPLLSDSIDSLLKNRPIECFRYKREFVKIQYKFVNEYISFIDKNEEKDYKSDWWKTRLSGKNPWISKFFLRFCQIKVIENLLKLSNSKSNILILVEEKSVYYSIISLLKKENFNHTELIKNFDLDYINLIFKGVLRRFYSCLYYPIKFLTIKLFFSSFWTKKFISNNVFTYSFIDSRCFDSNGFSDPFLGKFLKKINLNRGISFVPVLTNISLKKLLIFKKWIHKNKYSVRFPIEDFSLKFYFKLFSLPKTTSKVFFCGINVAPLINYERYEEWSNFSLHNELISNLTKKISNSNHNKLILYPFENQIWERYMLSEFYGSAKKNYVIGLQNAPSPKLSTRFFCSNKTKNNVPIPNSILTTGLISYENLINFWPKKLLRKFSSSRKLIKKINNNIDSKNIMVACSISYIEAIELIMFCVNTFKNLDFKINIVPHPLSKFNYNKLLSKLNLSNNFTINLDYKAVMLKSKFILFDSSTAGIEGLMNGLVPIRIAHKHSIHVNPSEYETKYSHVVYEKKELLNIIKFNQKKMVNNVDLALKYYEFKNANQYDEIKLEINQFIDG